MSNKAALEIQDELLIRDVETLKAIADAARLRILRTFYGAGEPRELSTKQVRQELGEKGATRLYYHMQKLEQAGILRKVREAKRGNLVESFFLPAARVIKVSPELTHGMSREMAFAVIETTRTDLEELRGDIDPEETIISQRELDLSPEEFTSFRRELNEVVARYEKMRGGSRAVRMSLVVYPMPDGDAQRKES